MKTPHPPPITLYFLQASRCIRTAWLLEALSLPYTVKFSDRVNNKAPQDFKSASGNPLGKFPTLVHGDTTVYESGAITEFLCEKYDSAGKLIPKVGHDERRARCLMWVHASEGAFMLHALSITYLNWFAPSNSEKFVQHTQEGMSVNVQKDFDWLEVELGKSQGRFLLGKEVTAADIMVHFSAQFVLARGLGTKGKSWPKVEQWLKDCESDKNYKRAVEKTGYTLFPKSM